MKNLAQQAFFSTNQFATEITKYLKPEDSASKAEICKRVEEKMVDVTSGDYAAKITETIKSVMAEAFNKGVDEELLKIMKI